ncbi:hypothetical protein [Methanolobus vulcani]|jgi:hypothetical protein|uniref:Uncharacterized protein n=1 Tax=Methanolobus vulcani TaxID=38026 RepID=A0A7Z8KR54_9EURY|nr:hypothetical protein [Methanolobus vulcani]TQD26720.1 hypothetical protein FKV42_04500 [Methanolobus vulcani]
MYLQIAEYKNTAYETHKNGLFWQTYIYKKDIDHNYRLIDIARFLVEPEAEAIHEIIDRAASAINQQFPDSKGLNIHSVGELS